MEVSVYRWDHILVERVDAVQFKLAFVEMRIIFIFLICFWINSALLASGELAEQQEHQKRPEENEHPKTQSYDTSPLDNRSSATVNIQLPTPVRTENITSQSGQEKKETWTTWAAGWGTGIIAIFTIILAWISHLQRQILKATLTANKATERAYLNASPGSPVMSPLPNQGYLVEVRIENFGETPATVTRIAIHSGPQLPVDPEKPGPPDSTEHFLVKTQYFFYRVSWPQNLGSAPHFLFGYIDYRTIFEEPYRLVFARVYDPTMKEFSFISQSGYNYVRPRKKKEE